MAYRSIERLPDGQLRDRSRYSSGYLSVDRFETTVARQIHNSTAITNAGAQTGYEPQRWKLAIQRLRRAIFIGASEPLNMLAHLGCIQTFEDQIRQDGIESRSASRDANLAAIFEGVFDCRSWTNCRSSSIC